MAGASPVGFIAPHERPSPASGQRVTWAGLPDPVRAAVEDVLGSPVVRAVSQPGGFSPGSADRVVTADGRRAFVKAVGTPLNPDSPGIHRREVAITATLPAAAPAPRLLGSYDDRRGTGVLHGVARDTVTAVVAGLAGYLSAACRRPPVHRMPTIRAFQRAQAEVSLSSLRRRTGWT